MRTLYDRQVPRPRQPVQTVKWRKRRPGDGFESIELSVSGSIQDRRRCSAVGLELGDCQMPRIDGSHYCYYHDKVQAGLLEPDAPVYPVWPLPADGYVLQEPPARQFVGAVA